MLTAIGAWFAKEGVALLLGALAKLALDAFTKVRADAALKQAGAAETAARTNAETVETQDAMDEVPRPSDDAVADSLRTGKF